MYSLAGTLDKEVEISEVFKLWPGGLIIVSSSASQLFMKFLKRSILSGSLLKLVNMSSFGSV